MSKAWLRNVVLRLLPTTLQREQRIVAVIVI